MKEFKDKTDKKDRSLIIDTIRGFTVVLMIIFHFSFDLNYFGIIKFDILHHPFWYAFPRIIVFLFLFATGSSLYLAHKNSIKWKSFFKRLALIFCWAIAISIANYILFPDNWIYFGTLHAIGTISIMCLPFLKWPRLSLVIALMLFIPSLFLNYNLPWIEFAHQSWDYISPFPWLGAALFGVFAAHKGLSNVKISKNSATNALSYLGKHSLFIYILHQPVLFAIILSFLKVKSFLVP